MRRRARMSVAPFVRQNLDPGFEFGGGPLALGAEAGPRRIILPGVGPFPTREAPPEVAARLVKTFKPAG